jgi:hypothetical protein
LGKLGAWLRTNELNKRCVGKKAMAIGYWLLLAELQLRAIGRGGAPVFRWARISPCVVYIILCEAKSTIPGPQHDSGSQNKNPCERQILATIVTLA